PARAGPLAVARREAARRAATSGRTRRELRGMARAPRLTSMVSSSGGGCLVETITLAARSAYADPWGQTTGEWAARANPYESSGTYLSLRSAERQPPHQKDVRRQERQSGRDLDPDDPVERRIAVGQLEQIRRHDVEVRGHWRHQRPAESG